MEYLLKLTIYWAITNLKKLQGFQIAGVLIRLDCVWIIHLRFVIKNLKWVPKVLLSRKWFGCKDKRKWLFDPNQRWNFPRDQSGMLEVRELRLFIMAVNIESWNLSWAKGIVRIWWGWWIIGEVVRLMDGRY